MHASDDQLSVGKISPSQSHATIVLLRGKIITLNNSYVISKIKSSI